MAQPLAPKPVRLPPHANAEAHARVMAALQRMTPAEFLDSLVHAGICTPDGKLTEHYADGSDEPETRK